MLPPGDAAQATAPRRCAARARDDGGAAVSGRSEAAGATSAWHSAAGSEAPNWKVASGSGAVPLGTGVVREHGARR